MRLSRYEQVQRDVTVMADFKNEKQNLDVNSVLTS